MILERLSQSANQADLDSAHFDTLPFLVDFNAIDQQGSTFFSVPNLEHVGRLVVEALRHFLLFSEASPIPPLSFWHDTLLWKLVLSSSGDL